MTEYEFTLADGRVFRFAIGEEEPPSTAELPSWTALGFHQCRSCPLQAATSPRCPTAVDVFRITERFADMLSHERVHVRVLQRNKRTYEIDCDLQTGLGSLLGLVMASSGCPVLGQLQGLARFHLPFADFDETLFRTVGLYLLRQYFVARDGGQPDFELAGLARLYEQLQEVNRAFKRRIEGATPRDASINAVTMLFSLSALVAMSLESGLDQLRELLALAPEGGLPAVDDPSPG